MEELSTNTVLITFLYVDFFVCILVCLFWKKIILVYKHHLQRRLSMNGWKFVPFLDAYILVSSWSAVIKKSHITATGTVVISECLTWSDQYFDLYLSITTFYLLLLAGDIKSTIFVYIIIQFIHKSPLYNNLISPGLHIKEPCFTSISLVQG